MTQIQLYQDDSNQWRWRAIAANNRNVANGGEGYHNVTDMLQEIENLWGAAAASQITVGYGNTHDDPNAYRVPVVRARELLVHHGEEPDPT
jgi:uncharacterized protein YegP (UPF0339 family)